MASARYDYLTEHEEEQTAKTLEQLESQKDNDKGYQHGNACTHKQLNSSGYFGQENVQEFQKEMVSHLFGKDAPKKKGRGMFFDTKEEIDEWIEKYFGLCMRTQVVPTISGLCTYLKCHRQTLYEHANNPNSHLYESCRQAIEYCHVCLEAGASESKLNSVAYIFQAKNYFNMKDTQEIQVQANSTQELNSPETLKALQDQKASEAKGRPLEIEVREAKIIEEKTH